LRSGERRVIPSNVHFGKTLSRKSSETNINSHGKVFSFLSKSIVA